jgi:hypothetical protein
MYTTKTGQKFGSSFVGKKKDALHSADENAPHLGPKSTDMPSGSPSNSAAKEPSRTNPAGEAKFSAANAAVPDNDVKAEPEGVDAGAVAAEHGPAASVTTHHDHKAGKHMVVSHHPDGHMHSSQHKSHADAHAAAKQLSGPANEENTDKDPNADAGQGNMFGGGESDGFNMPSLG